MKHWGRVKNNLDSKGRVSLPARFRRDDVEYYVLNQGFDGCLFLFTPEQYEKTLEKIQERSRNQKKYITICVYGPCTQPMSGSTSKVGS